MTTTQHSEPVIVVCGECGSEVHQDTCECHACAKEGRPQWSPQKPSAPTAPDDVAPEHEDWP